MDKPKINEKEGFTLFFNSFLKVYNLQEIAVCRELKISKKTFNRWVSGLSAPHPMGRAAIYESLAEIMSAPTGDKATADRIRHTAKKAGRINAAVTRYSEKIKPGQYKLPPKKE